MKCIQCGFENEVDAEYCEQCGSALMKTCPQCGNLVKPKAKFCNRCGARLTHTTSTTDNSQKSVVPPKPAPIPLQLKPQSLLEGMEGERKLVTILFTDIVGSTSLAEKTDPEEWKEIVAGAHQRVSDAIYRYEGTIAQLLGDGVLALFGAPVTHEDDPVRAIRAALDIQNSMPDYRRQLAGLADDFQMRIGIHTGTVVAGPVGDDRHTEYLAVGDAVNLAARLQSAAQPGGVLVSETTARLISASFGLNPLGPISLKGKNEPVTVFEVLRGKTLQESSRGFEELRSRMVGRKQELKLLRDTLDSLVSGRGQIVTVFGEAGIGKSRLVEEECRSMAGDPERLFWIEGRALSYGQGLSFWMITQLIFSDLKVSDGDPEIRIRAALKKRATELFGEQTNQYLPYLMHLTGMHSDANQVQQISILDGETLRHQVLRTITAYFEHMANQKPTVVVFEDLHWVDPSSLEALEKLLPLTDRFPLMLLLVARLERDQAWWKIKLKAETDYAHRYTEIQLKPLSDSEQNQLVDNLLMLARMPKSVRQLIMDRAEGIPFYLEEILRALIDQGAIRYTGNAWRVTEDLQDISLPTTIQGVLLSRIDRLPEDVRRTLQLAAVIGRSFLYRLLKAVSSGEQQLDQHLAQLQRLDLIREKSRQPELEYIFKHSLTQEAAYHSLLVERRQVFHQSVGEALEKLYTDRKEQFLGLLAYHFEASGDSAKAVNYLIQAGDQARLSDEHTEAIGYYQRALIILEDLKDDDRAAQVWFKLGLIYNANFQFEESHQAYEAAFRLQHELPQPGSLSTKTKPHTLRFSIRYPFIKLDPGIDSLFEDTTVDLLLFSGLAKLNEDMDVVPEIARSWQVLDGGRRYLFHLRDDFNWSDGTPVTAIDFEWTWKRNLDPVTRSHAAGLFYDIVGARDYNQGVNPDPKHVGIHALDAHTLEVVLSEPVAYFPFLLTVPVTFPIPRAAVEKYGADWWRPEHIVTSGPYQLIEFDPQHRCSIERDPRYPGKISGNIDRIEWIVGTSNEERLRGYFEDRFDLVDMPAFLLPEGFPKEELISKQLLQVTTLIFDPGKPPLNDPRVRKAFAHALDRRSIDKQYHRFSAYGGLVPPGMPGHSPDISLPYNIALGQKYLADAGYPGGRGFPEIIATAPPRFVEFFAAEYSRYWNESLGVVVHFKAAEVITPEEWRLNRIKGSIFLFGWLADYPDPDNFLRQSDMIAFLNSLGWRDVEYDNIVEEAAKTSDRGKRMAMYRWADRLLVHDQALLLPISYGASALLQLMVKPWVGNFKTNSIGMINYPDLIIKEH